MQRRERLGLRVRWVGALDLDGTEDVGSARGGVGLGIPDTTTDDGSTDETSTTDGDTSEGDGGQELSNLDGHLLRSVGEVVGTSRHEVVGTSGLGADGTTVEEGRGHVEVVAVLGVLLVVVVVASSRGIRLAAISLAGGIADGRLVNVGKLVGKLGGEELDILDLVGVVSASLGTTGGGDGNKVGTIILIKTVTSLVGRVVVGTSPLEVDVVSTGDLEGVGGEIVLTAGVALDDVSTTTTDSQVEDTGTSLNVSRALNDLEGVRTIREGTTELVGVDVEGEVAEATDIIDTVVDVGVVGHRGLILTVVGSIDHLTLTLINVGKTVVITRRDVVTKTESAGGVLLVLVEVNVGDDPLVVLSHDVASDVNVTQVVVARLGGSEAIRSADTPLFNLNPLVAVLGARLLFPVRGLVGPDVRDVESLVPVHFGGRGIGDNAETLGLDVLRLLAVVVAATSLRAQDGDILPGGGSPVGIVITLLRALKTVTVVGISVGVLTSSFSRVGVDVLVSGEETLVAVTQLASIVPRERLLLSTLTSQQVVLSVVRHEVVTVVLTNGGGGTLFSTVTDPGATHVLQHKVTISVQVVRAATVLGGPLDLKQRAFIIRHGVTPLVTTLRIVLRVEQTVLVLRILVLFVQLVVRAARGMDVNIRHTRSDQDGQDHRNQHRLVHLLTTKNPDIINHHFRPHTTTATVTATPANTHRHTNSRHQRFHHNRSTQRQFF